MSLYKINRLVFAFVLRCFLALAIGSFVDYLYYKNSTQKRGYSVDVVESNESGASATAKMIELGFLMAEATVEAGEKVAVKCALCHTFKKGEPHKTGPNLWNVVGETPATKAGFDYSAAMKANQKKWSIEHLAKYLHAPQKVVPGTKMSFAGVKNDKELANLLVYLSSLNDKKVDLPAKDFKVSLE